MARLDQALVYPVRAVSIGPKVTVPGQRNPGAVIGNVRIITASGGMVTGVSGMYGVSCARAGVTGMYTLTFPAVPSGSRLELKYGVEIGQVAMFASGVTLNIYSGTAAFQVGGIVSNLNPAAGDVMTVDFYMDPSTLANTAP